MKFGQRKKVRRYIYIISAFILAVIFFASALNKVKEGLEYLFYPLKASVYNFSLKSRNNINNMFNVEDMLKNNRVLKDEYYKLKLENLELKRYEKENERLREVLTVKKSMRKVYSSANVVFRDSFSVYENFYIDKGEDEGIEKDMVVIYKDILVGKVSKVHKKRSKVDLLSKNGFYVSAVSSDGKNLGVLKGQNTKKLRFDYVIIDAKVEVGDLVKSSGISEIYPKGITIGYVSKVERGKDNLFKAIEVEIPYRTLDINEVLILKRR